MITASIDFSVRLEIGEELAKHGLVIVEASKWGSAKAALMVIGSCAALDGKSAETALELAAEVARRELKKIES